jgi:glycosyltransferase involved in cell wall biosynthesis
VYDLRLYQDTVDVCVADSTLAARVARRATALPEDRIVSIPGGVHRPRVARTEVEAGHALRLGYVGRLEQVQKRVLDLPVTLCALDGLGVPFTCRIVGGGTEETRLRETLASAGLQDRVRFEGWTPRQALYETVYPQLDVLLHFAEWEGNPISPREAMAHGVVPVMSRFRGCSAEGTFQDGSTVLLFDVGDAEAAARHVARLHDDRALLHRLSVGTRAALTESSFVDGAVAAWAETLRRVRAMPLRVPSDRRPRLSASGSLASLGVPPRLAALARKLVGRQPVPRVPADEWPHSSGMAAYDDLESIRQLARALDGPEDA